MLRLLLAGLFCGLAAPALAQDADEPGSNDHPMVPRLAAYYIQNYEASDFNKADFAVADDKTETIEGKHWRIVYSIRENARHESPLAILRNYQNAFQGKGGELLVKDDYTATLRLRTGAAELWCRIEVANEGDLYTVEIVEKGAMAQQVELNAAQLAKALDETGSVALHDILFDSGKATIQPSSSATLAAVAELLKNDPALRLEIQGHTDNVGSNAANQALSQARAAAVREHLIKTFGIAADRLAAAGFGHTRPIADNATETGRAQNRRVQLVKLGTRAGSGGPPRAGQGEWTGRVTAGMMAIGGETTGIVLATAQDQIELQPADQAMRRRLQQLDGRTVTVRGTLETKAGVEIRSRRIINVTEVIERN